MAPSSAGACGKPAVGAFLYEGVHEPTPLCAKHREQVTDDAGPNEAVGLSPAPAGATCAYTD